MSFPSHHIGMSEIHTLCWHLLSATASLGDRVFVVHLHCLLPESDTVYQQHISGSSGERINTPQSSYFLCPKYRLRQITLSAARHSSNGSYLEPSPEGKSRRNRKTESTAILIIVHSSMCRR